MQDMRAIQRYGGEQIAAIITNTNGRGRITFRDKSIDNTQVEGVSSSYVNFSATPPSEAASGPHRGGALAAGHGARRQTADRLFGANVDPIDKIIQIEGVLPGRGRERKKGSMLGQSGQLRHHPARPVRDDVRIATVARSPDQAQGHLQPRCGAGRSDGRPARRARLGRSSPTTSACARPTRSGHLPIGDQRHLRGAGRRRGLSLVVRACHHEHHADGGERADARSAAQGARREASDIMSQMLTESVVLSVFGGVVGTILGSSVALAVSTFTRFPRRSKSGRWCWASRSPRSSASSSACTRRPARRPSTRSRRSGGNDQLMATIRLGLVKEVVSMAFDTVRTNKMRSGLTVLGIVIGITAIVGMTALIRGFDQSVRDLLATIGPNTIFVQRFGITDFINGAEIRDLLRRPNLTATDALALKNEATTLQYVDLERRRRGATVQQRIFYRTLKTKISWSSASGSSPRARIRSSPAGSSTARNCIARTSSCHADLSGCSGNPE
jgi:hypothetical protein